MPLKPDYACDTPRSCDRTGNRGPLATCRSAAAAAGTLCDAIVLVATSCCGLRPAHAAERAASYPAVAPLQLQHYPQWIHQGLQVLFDARPGYSLEPVREPPLCQQFRAVPRPAAFGYRAPAVWLRFGLPPRVRDEPGWRVLVLFGHLDRVCPHWPVSPAPQ